ncbi:hypothetical protein BC827DRAFT_1266797 [Russula dissimulans]|nr:hypothetical protein BC827DRAFT_1266797 [Russula dissimulans]
MPPPTNPTHPSERTKLHSQLTVAPLPPSEDQTTAVPSAKEHQDSGFTKVTHGNKGNKNKRNKGKTAATTGNDFPRQVIITPASYTEVTASVPNGNQKPNIPTSRTNHLPAITEVMVVRQGGHIDPQTELSIRARAADAIVREVCRNMSKAVARPIPLRAGFGQLCPSLGWTRLIVHGVPFTDDDGMVFGPNALLQETQTLPGLRKAFFAMPPRWLKPVERIKAGYTSITFAISDPDGSTTTNLLQGRSAMFARKTQKAKDKGKGREWDLVQDPNEEERLTAKEAEYDFGDKDLFNPISLPPEATFCQICEARNKEVDRAIYNTMVGSTSTAGPSLSMLPRDAGPQPMDYSLLRPQGSAAIGPVTQ